MNPSGMTWNLLTTASVLLIFSFPADFSRAANTISPGQSLSVNQTIVSEGGIFELGYFTPGSSQKYYIGIWYKKISERTVVWVANRDEPISDAAASEFKLSADGNLVLNQAGTQVWSSNITSPASGSTVAVLLDTGNFVLRNASNSSSVLWESFDHPTDTWLPGQRLGFNRITGEVRLLVSWRSSEDPSSGLFAEGLDPDGSAQLVMWRNGTEYWSTGLWDGRAFANIPAMQSSRMMNFDHVTNEEENYFTYNFSDTSSISRSFMDLTGQMKVTKWLESSKEWLWVCLMPMNPCLPSSLCGAYGSCSAQTLPFCSCLQGFVASNSRDWELDNWSGGCTRRTSLQCGNSNSVNEAKDEFFEISNVKLPRNSEKLEAGSAEECASACLNSCSCTAYSYSNGCFVWQGDLYDLTQLDTSHSDSSSGADWGVLYLRLAASEFPGASSKKRRPTTKIIVGLASASLGLLILVALICRSMRGSPLIGSSDKFEGSLVSFRYKSLSKATNNFSDKLGAGSFGTVFRGTLPDSTAIAVKKLEKLGQGEKQFRAEVSTIGMIQHVNLVPLRGFCCEGSERLLVYDYMPNGSLSDLLFRNRTSKVLDWETRYRIALGVATGLAYLHEKCRDCIIHCDVKPDNILIDAEFSAKVTDFGMAKLVGREFSKVLTTIRGTLGYLAPEWVYGLPITEKADVYSYGMMLLEILSGRRNTAVSDDGAIAFFPMFAAKMANEDDVVSLLDERLDGDADMDQLRRACRVAVWCIQDEQDQRPTMGLVVQILEGVSEVNIPPVPMSFYNLE